MRKLLFFVITFFTFIQLSAQTTRNLNSENWTFQQKGDSKWLKAEVPGSVHTDLMLNNIIPNPYKDINDAKVQWVENEDWTYKTSFDLTDAERKAQNIQLKFNGLDTYAKVFVNGKLILDANNMFRIWEVSVKDFLKNKNNLLEIQFKSSSNEGKQLANLLPYKLPEGERVYTRKAQYQYGWDWGLRLVTAGIYKPIELISWNNFKLNDLSYEILKLEKNQAKVKFKFVIQSEQNTTVEINFNQKKITQKLTKGINYFSIDETIQNPKLWWPNGMGEQYLYDYQFKIRQGNEQVSKHLKFGLRTIELVQEKDNVGSSFYFKVNGIPTYMKGANYIPQDNFVSRVSKNDYEKLINSSVEANMNMIRIWGGGIYEDDYFYELCDEKGLLVWQDFMYACAFYPGDQDFLNNVKQETIDQVNRLKNHTSIALWCGNNEIDEAWHNWGYQKQMGWSKQDSLSIWKDYQTTFHHIIPNVLDSILSKSENRYWPSSPSIGWGRKESLTQGDSHYWGVWWGMEPFETYEKKVPRFASEYGFQGMPTLETVKSMFSEKDTLSKNSVTILVHQKHPKGWETINEYMQLDYAIPTDFVQYNYVSQLLKARGTQIGIEAHRRAKPYNMGSLYWQLNDVWPVTSWASLDKLGNWKALHYQVKRSFENVLISVEKEENVYKIYIINDLLKDLKGKVKFSIIDFNGNKRWTNDKDVIISSNSSTKILELSNEVLKGTSSIKSFLRIEFESNREKYSSNYFFEKPKDLALTKPTIKIKKISSNQIEISTNVLAKDVYLLDGNNQFDDNFFDLIPNETRIINGEKAIQNLKIYSLYETMNAENQ
ncbi:MULTISPECIES: beta-mannosidase [Empedobacter]|uniref:beta-mannosidase n=1 Tax=Empedobacter TaxID=59734 RepID=UPI0025784A6A|nr:MULTISPECIES: glycoside hydrolase family 2 protein [Empedobacter]MDM1042321.1 glycoside hydrolase family 2 protein [Empedobacter brevis]MDM1136302.1 glycoside hydrolase family 2 protein [Empedobacter sp. R750]